MSKTILILALIGLIGCVTKNYYSIYPIKTVQCDHRPVSFEFNRSAIVPFEEDWGIDRSIEPGSGQLLTPNSLIDTSFMADDYYLIFETDTIK